jgi:hypothetical protein
MIIGVCGRAGSGKDTVADVLVREHGFVKVSFADPLKRICREVFDFSDEQLWGSSEKRNVPDRRYQRVPGYLTPRYALQRLGTEWGRDCYEEVWVDYALRVAAKLLGPAMADGRRYRYHPTLGLVVRGDMDPLPSGVVIPDVRFPNEVVAIRETARGRIWKTTRGAGLAEGAGAHESERYADEIAADHEFPADLALEDLPAAVAAALGKP